MSSSVVNIFPLSHPTQPVEANCYVKAYFNVLLFSVLLLSFHLLLLITMNVLVPTFQHICTYNARVEYVGVITIHILSPTSRLLPQPLLLLNAFLLLV